MKNFDYQTPTRLIFGRDVVAGLPEGMRPFVRPRERTVERL